jgi:hypothetical protein
LPAEIASSWSEHTDRPANNTSCSSANDRTHVTACAFECAGRHEEFVQLCARRYNESTHPSSRTRSGFNAAYGHATYGGSGEALRGGPLSKPCGRQRRRLGPTGRLAKWSHLGFKTERDDETSQAPSKRDGEPQIRCDIS